MAQPTARTLVIACTGASGARLADRFLKHLLGHPGVGRLYLVCSHAFSLVLE